MSDYFSRVDTSMPPLQSMEVDEHMVSHVPESKGKPERMGQSMLQNVNSFCTQDACIMEKWIERFTTAQQVRHQQRRAYRRAHKSHIQFAPKLEEISDNDIQIGYTKKWRGSKARMVKEACQMTNGSMQEDVSQRYTNCVYVESNVKHIFFNIFYVSYDI